MVPAAVSPALVERALALIVAAEAAPPEHAARERGRLTRWRADSAVHEAAYAEARRRWDALGALGPGLRERFAEPAPARPRRRGLAARGALLVAVLAVAVGGMLAYRERPTFDRVYETGVAQLMTVRLPDGDRIDLNARSALRVTLYRHRRLVEFWSGDARFEVAPDPRRPFQVRTRHGVVEALGTVFVIADRGGPVSVEVERGRVRFSPAAPQPGVEIGGGQRIAVGPGGVDRVGAAREPAAWRDGWLIFDNEALAEAVTTINAFRERPVRLAGDGVGALRLTGRFRAADSRGLLAALPRILPVVIRERADGTVDVQRR
jgi:transmembrane sensor